MGMTAALKFRSIVSNAEAVLAIELLTAAEGLDYRAPLRSSKSIERARELVRRLTPRLTQDRPLANDIEMVTEALRSGYFDEFRDDL
jgi:histidine ammonia-lyase